MRVAPGSPRPRPGWGAAGRRFPVLLAVAAGQIVAPAAAQPVAEFVSGRVLVLEDSGVATAQVILTGVTWSTVTVAAATADGEGTADLGDYVGTGTFALWNRFENGIREVSFEVRVDADVEPDETVYFDLLPSNNGMYQLGSITRCEVVIVDDDTGLRPFFEVAPPLRLAVDGNGYFLADTDETVELTVRLGVPAPAGYAAPYSIDGGQPLLLPFAEGSTSATILLEPPAGPVPVLGFGQRTVALLAAGPDMSKDMFVDMMNGAYWTFDSATDRQNCMVCLLLVALHGVAGSEETCPLLCVHEGFDDYVCAKTASAVPDDIVAVLRAYRDNVLTTTDSGLYYVALYRQLSAAMAHAAFRDMNLLFALKDAADEWIPAFAALADGNGAGAVVTPTMQAGLGAILDGLEASGDAAVIEAVQRERTRLLLDAVADLSMDQLQDRLETLGGGVPAQDESWGNLKAQYR